MHAPPPPSSISQTILHIFDTVENMIPNVSLFFFNKTGTLTQPAILSLLPCRCCFSSFLAAAAACSSPFLSSRPSAVPSKPRYEQGRPALEIHYRCCCFVSSSPLLRRTGEGRGVGGLMRRRLVSTFPPVISFNGVRGVFSRLLCPSWLRLFPLLPNPGIFCSANARAPFRCPLRSCERRCAFSRLFNVCAASTWQNCGAFVRVDWIVFFCCC
jgi:hypothetical protein